MLSTEQQQKAITALLKRAENALCADCNSKSPCWASLDFGVFVCMNCSGAHRALGPSVTRVKSTKLDSWQREWLQKMQVGNSVLNEYWQHQLTGLNRNQKPNVNTSLNQIIKFVNNKYVKRRYAKSQIPVDPIKIDKNQEAQKNQEVTKPKFDPTNKEPISPLINNYPKPANHPYLLSFGQSQNQPAPNKSTANSNLICFQEQPTKQSNLIAFEESIPKHNNQNYLASQPQQSQQITFDHLVSNFGGKPAVHHNHFFPNNHLNYYPQPHYPSQNHFSAQHSLPIHLNSHSLSQSSRTPEAISLNLKETSWKAEPAGKITLETNLEWSSDPKQKQEVNQSWTDSWK